MRAVSIGFAISTVAAITVPGASYAQGRDSGQYWFSTYCASCHGKEGRGNGPVAKALSRPPADLTRLAADSGGTFPAERIIQVIDGRHDVAAHGTREMPVWGRALRFGPSVVRTRVRAIIDYVSTLQLK